MNTDDSPIPISVACKWVFQGMITPATLRAEARRGKLAIFRIGRRDYTTRAALAAMVELCRVGPKDHVSTSIGREAHGLSETDRRSSEVAACKAMLLELKERSRSTSVGNIDRHLDDSQLSRTFL